jgi:hypothetical protein
MDPIPPTLPFHLAKAYGVRPAAKTDRPAITVTPVAPGVDRIDGVRAPADTADLATTRKAEAIRRAPRRRVVPGGVAFENGTARATAPAVSPAGGGDPVLPPPGRQERRGDGDRPRRPPRHPGLTTRPARGPRREPGGAHPDAIACAPRRMTRDRRPDPPPWRPAPSPSRPTGRSIRTSSTSTTGRTARAPPGARGAGAYRAEMERDAVSFFAGRVWDLIDESRKALAGCWGARRAATSSCPTRRPR